MAIVNKYSINSLKIIYPVPRSVQENGDKSYNVITSGTYTTDGGYTSAGVIMIGGTLRTAGDAKTYLRGGVAVLEDGRIVVSRMRMKPNTGQNLSKQDIIEGIQAIGEDYSVIGHTKVVDFMGGGAMVVENGSLSLIDDVTMIQKFNQGGNGYKSAQLTGARPRVAIGTMQSGAKGGRAELLILDGDTQVEAKALASSYNNLVVFDGGYGFWAHDRKGYHSSPDPQKGANATGLGVI
jgi:hypothetical protein